jgi:hypothetical protein
MCGLLCEIQKNLTDALTQDKSAAIHLYTIEWDTGADLTISKKIIVLIIHLVRKRHGGHFHHVQHR